MQVKIFTVSAIGGELASEEMNVFLRAKKVLQLESHFVDAPSGAYWTFCVKYMDDLAATERERQKVDYRKLLGEEAFARFSQLREVRKRIAGEENVPAYAILADEELAELAKMERVTEAAMRKVKGIGDKKMEKYARFFVTPTPP